MSGRIGRQRALRALWMAAVVWLGGAWLTPSPAVADTLTLTKATVSLRFTQVGKDSASFTGTFVFGQNVTLANQVVGFDLCGIAGQVVLDAKEKSPKGGPTVAFKVAGHKVGEVIPAGTTATVTITVKGTLAGLFRPHGVGGLQDVTRAPFQLSGVDAMISVGGQVFETGSAPGTWKVPTGVAGTFTLAKVPARPALVNMSHAGATPGDLLQITGVKTSATKVYRVLFANGGPAMPVLARVSAPGTLEVAVPPFLAVDEVTGAVDFGAGTVRVLILEESGSSLSVLATVDDFQIGPLPETGLPPGTVTLALLDQLDLLAEAAIANWETTDDFAGGKVDSAELRARLAEIRERLQTFRSRMGQLAAGQVSDFAFGQFAGQQLMLDQAILATMDRIFAAYLARDTGVAASTLAAPAALPAPAADPVQAIEDLFANFRASELPEELRRFADRFHDAGAAAVGAATVGAILLTGQVAAPATAGSLLTGLLWNASNFVPAMQMAALEGGTRQVALLGNTSLPEFKDTLGFVRDRATGRLVDALTGELVGGVTGGDELVGVATNLGSSVAQLPSDAQRPVNDAGKQIKIIGVARFNGTYSGTYSGIVTCTDLDDCIPGPENGLVGFTVFNGVITVTVPISGRGTVTSIGDTDFATAKGSGTSFDGSRVFFAGSLVVTDTGVVANGTWSSTFSGGSAAGIWDATSP